MTAADFCHTYKGEYVNPGHRVGDSLTPQFAPADAPVSDKQREPVTSNREQGIADDKRRVFQRKC
jgi:hypothetical protein